MNSALTPSALAKRWDCSVSCITAMIRRGDLPAFKIGAKLWRISTAVVEDVERCRQNSDLSCSEAITMPLGKVPVVLSEYPSVLRIVKLPSER